MWWGGFGFSILSHDLVPPPPPPTVPEKLEALRPDFCADGVHLSDSGRYHLFNNLAKTVMGLRHGSSGKPNHRNLPRRRRLLCFQARRFTGAASSLIGGRLRGPGRAEAVAAPTPAVEEPVAAGTAVSRVSSSGEGNRRILDASPHMRSALFRRFFLFSCPISCFRKFFFDHYFIPLKGTQA